MQQGGDFASGIPQQNINNQANLRRPTKRFDSAARPYRLTICGIRVLGTLQLSKAQQLQPLPYRGAWPLPIHP